MTGLTKVFVGGIQKTLRLWTRKGDGPFELCLMGHPCSNMEHSAENDLNCGSPSQEDSEGKNIVSKWGRDHTCDILWTSVR